VKGSRRKRPGRVGPQERAVPERPPHPRRSFIRFAPLLIVVACVAVYANSLNGPFLFDDQRTIEENPTIRQLWPLTVALQPPPVSPVTGRPLVNLSIAVNYALGGLNTRGYHLFSLAVHILTALALYGVLRRTFARPPTDTTASEPDVVRAWHTQTGAADLAALLCALVWAVHPLNSEVLNYLTQRSESLMALCYLLALYCAIRGLDATHPRRWDVGAFAAALFGIASKEVTLTAPLVILLWDRVFAFPSLRAAWTERWRLYALVIAACALYFVFGRTVYGDVTEEQQVSSWTYVLNQGPMILQYLKLSVWPARLIFDYGVPQAIALRDVWPSLAAVAVLFAAAAAALRIMPRVGFWAAWVFILLAPSSSIVPISAEVGAERRMYLPLVGVVVLLVIAVATLVSRFVRAPAVRRQLSWVAALMLLAAFSATTIARNSEYRTPLSIWQTVIDRRPQWRAHEHLSMHLFEAGRVDESIAQLRIAAKDSPNSRHALAAALLDRGDFAEAITRLREFIRDRPNDPDIVSARRELATALMKSGDVPGAIAELRGLAAARPDDPRARLELASAYEDAGDTDSAVAEYRAALKLVPNNVVALSHLGVLLASRQPEESRALLQRAIGLDPNAIGVRLQLIQLLLEGQDFAAAEQQARAGLALAPASAEGHNLLGVALASQGRIPESAREFAEAVRLDPNHHEARANLERAERRSRGAGSRKE
jgi:Flp pilus assembly protein TadD